MIKLLSATITIMSLTIILAIVVSYWLIIAYIEAVSGEAEPKQRQTITRLQVKPTISDYQTTANNYDIKVQLAPNGELHD